MACQAAFISERKKWLPEPDVPLAPGSAHRVLTYDPATDKAVWQGNTVIRRDDPIPDWPARYKKFSSHLPVRKTACVSSRRRPQIKSPLACGTPSHGHVSANDDKNKVMPNGDFYE